MACCKKWEELSSTLKNVHEIQFCPYCGKEREPLPEFIETTVYLYSDRNSMWSHGEELGLSVYALEKFQYALYEVECVLRVNTKTGEVEVVELKSPNTTRG